MVMTVVRVTLVLVGTAAYLGLAILGWGGWTAFFAHPARVVLAVVLAVLAGVSLCADGNLSPGLREDRGNRWVIVALTLLGLLAAYLPAYTDRKACWTLDGDPLRWLGVGLFAAGGALRIWPVFVLGHRFSGLVAIQPGHTLVTPRILWGHPSPELSRIARQRLGLGPRLSGGDGRSAHDAHYPAAPSAHPCNSAAAAHAGWRCIRRVLSRTSRLIPGSIARCEPMHPLVRGPLCVAWRIIPHQPSLPAVLPRKRYPRTEEDARSSGLGRTYAPQACRANASALLLGIAEA